MSRAEKREGERGRVSTYISTCQVEGEKKGEGRRKIRTNKVIII
jgi:hypothetical protein